MVGLLYYPTMQQNRTKLADKKFQDYYYFSEADFVTQNNEKGIFGLVDAVSTHENDNYLLENGGAEAMYQVLYGTTTGYTSTKNPFTQVCDGRSVPANCSMFTFAITGNEGMTVNGYNTRVRFSLLWYR
jgi:hypothetical protein